MTTRRAGQTNRRSTNVPSAAASTTDDLRFYDPLVARSYEPKVEYLDVRDSVADERAQTIFNHKHTGLDGENIDIASLVGFFELVSVVPTRIPKTFFDSIKFYDDATNRRIYVYINGVWRFCALT